MQGKSLLNRLQNLESRIPKEDERAAWLPNVVIYDAETGAPLTPVPAAPVVLWLPDNGRADCGLLTAAEP